MTISYVYKITNKINNKIYIGKSNNPFNRLRRHFSIAKTVYDKNHKYQYIHRAITKYGKENFVLEIIETCDSEEIAYEREKYWIAELKSNIYGYNLNKGGFGGYTHSEDVIRRISQSKTGKINTFNGLFKKLYKIFKFLPNYKEIYKPLSEIKRLEECQKKIKQMNISKVDSLNDEVKKLILQLHSFDCFYRKDIAEALGLKLETIVYVICRYKKNGVLSEEQKHINRSNSHKGKTLSEEHKKNISKSNIGKVILPCSREKISKANSGENNGMSGKTHSNEVRQKMSEFQSSRPHRPLTEEEKKHLSETFKGKPRPPRIPLDIKQQIIEMWNSGNYTKKQLAAKFALKYHSIAKIVRVK